MYDVKEFHFGRSSPVEVQVSFSLSGPDWSKFEKSDAWQTQGKKAELQ